jgi:hypothetical protein
MPSPANRRLAGMAGRRWPALAGVNHRAGSPRTASWTPVAPRSEAGRGRPRCDARFRAAHRQYGGRRSNSDPRAIPAISAVPFLFRSLSPIWVVSSEARLRLRQVPDLRPAAGADLHAFDLLRLIARKVERVGLPGTGAPPAPMSSRPASRRPPVAPPRQRATHPTQPRRGPNPQQAGREPTTSNRRHHPTSLEVITPQPTRSPRNPGRRQGRQQRLHPR